MTGAARLVIARIILAAPALPGNGHAEGSIDRDFVRSPICLVCARSSCCCHRATCRTSVPPASSTDRSGCCRTSPRCSSGSRYCSRVGKIHAPASRSPAPADNAGEARQLRKGQEKIALNRRRWFRLRWPLATRRSSGTASATSGAMRKSRLRGRQACSFNASLASCSIASMPRAPVLPRARPRSFSCACTIGRSRSASTTPRSVA